MEDLRRVPKAKILAVCPYEGMRSIMANVAVRHEDVMITTVVGDLDAGVRAAQQALAKQDYDIILSRGGTADMISHAVDIPVLEIPVSVGDLLQAMKMVEGYQDKFAIVGRPEIIRSAELVSEMLSYEVVTRTFQDRSKKAQIIADLKRDGYNMILCDTSTADIARSIGITAVLIASGAENIESALSQAIRLSRSYGVLKRRCLLFEKTIRHGSEIVMIYTPEGRRLFSSLDWTEESAPVFVAVEQLIERLTGEVSAESMLEDGRRVSVKAGPVSLEDEELVLAYVSLARDHLPVQPDNGIRFFNKGDEIDYFPSYDTVGAARDAILEYGRSDSPVLIMGEEDAGQDAAAILLYENGAYAGKPFCRVDCGKITADVWTLLREYIVDAPAGREQTFYFKSLEKLDSECARQLVDLAERIAAGKQSRLLFSVNTGTGEKELPLWQDIIQRASCLTLWLQPLRERTEEIQSLATLHLSRLNLQIGKQIIGFDADAMETMKAYDWPGNLSQLKRVLHELSILTAQFYIMRKTVLEVLEKEGRLYPQGGQKTRDGLNLDLTLEEINHDIVRLVLAQEDGNIQSAARRLGISRSTIWRMTKAANAGRNV